MKKEGIATEIAKKEGLIPEERKGELLKAGFLRLSKKKFQHSQVGRRLQRIYERDLKIQLYKRIMEFEEKGVKQRNNSW